MTISLNRSYAGYPAGTVAQFDTPTETALVQQGIGSVTASPVTPGTLTTTQFSGRASIAAGQQAVTINNPSFTPQSKINATIITPLDATLVFIARISPVAGSVTIYGNTGATTAVQIDWVCQNLSGLTPVN